MIWWVSFEPPDEAVQPKVSWYGILVAWLIHAVGNVANAAFVVVVGSSPVSVCCGAE